MIHARNFAAVLAFVVACQPAWSQDQETLKSNLKEKLAAGFLKKAPWVLDLDQAKAEAKKSGKLIFAYFTRSYAT